MNIDRSNGYDGVAVTFVDVRGKFSEGIGTESVRKWARSMPRESMVLDMGCGTGLPLSKVLMDEGMVVYGIDASPALTDIFQRNFPGTHVACEAVEESNFFNMQFDGILAWGLIFLLQEDIQRTVLAKAARALKPGGGLLFTAPRQKASWKDLLTGRDSISLGVAEYREILTASSLSLSDGFEDEGGNYYYSAVSIK